MKEDHKMKKQFAIMVTAVICCLWFAPAALAKGKSRKVSDHGERIELIEGGRDIRIDPIPNRIPDYSSYRIQLIEFKRTLEIYSRRYMSGRPGRWI
jgi:hypothetical protein